MRRLSVAVLGSFVLFLAVAVPGLSQGKTCADCLAVLNAATADEFDAVYGIGPKFKDVLANTFYVVSPCTKEAIIAAVDAVRDKDGKQLDQGQAEVIVRKFCPWLFCDPCGSPGQCPECPQCPACPLCTVESLFVSPRPRSDDGVIKNRLIAILDAATHTVDLAMYSFTDDRLAEALIRAHRRGVVVRVIRDGLQSGNGEDENTRLRDAGIEVLVERLGGQMHHKFLVVDSRTTVTGSYNWSGAADKDNFENVVVIVCPEVASAFTTEFNRIWNALKAGLSP